MATLLDIGAGSFLNFFVPLFSLIFIATILYAILQKTKILGGKHFVDFLVSLLITILVVINSDALELANFVSVWAVVVLVMVVMLILVMFLWSKDGSFSPPDEIGEKLPHILFWVFIGIIAIGLTHVFGPVLTPYAEGANPNWVVLRTLFHPRLLGALVLLIIIGSLSTLLKKGK